MINSLLPLGTQGGELRKRRSIDEIIKTPVILFQARSRQWFNLFPDEIMIDLHKVVLTYRIFFDSQKVVSVPISAIMSATCSYTSFYGTLHVEIFGELKQPAPIEYLSRKEAIMAENMINGLIACTRQNVDLSPYPRDQIIRKLQEIGHI